MEKCANALKTLDNFKETAASMDIDAESPEFEESPGSNFVQGCLMPSFKCYGQRNEYPLSP